MNAEELEAFERVCKESAKHYDRYDRLIVELRQANAKIAELEQTINNLREPLAMKGVQHE